MELLVVANSLLLCCMAAFLFILPFSRMLSRLRLSDRFENELPKIVAELPDRQVDETCSICLEPLCGAKELPCEHRFHAESWLANQIFFGKLD